MKKITNALGFCNIKLRNLATTGIITGLIIIVGSMVLRDRSERWYVCADKDGCEAIQDVEKRIENRCDD